MIHEADLLTLLNGHVIKAAVVFFQLKVSECDLNELSFVRRDVPHAVLVGRISAKEQPCCLNTLTAHPHEGWGILLTS